MPESFSQSALRHLADADKLAASKAFHGAGYLIGYVAECAIKTAVEGAQPATKAPFKHLPELIDASKKMLKGRKHQSMLQVLSLPDMMSGWSTELRYEANDAVDEARFEIWRTSACRLLGAAGVKRQLT